MAWSILFLAGALEVVWSLALKYSDGFTRLVPSVVTAVAAFASVLFLGQASRTLPIGTAYSLWVGVGAAGAAVGGAALFGEAMPPIRIAFLALLLASIVGLKLTA